MPSPEILDFTKLLSPISDELPTGAPLRGEDSALDELYHQIRGARDAARDAERDLKRSEMARGTDSPAGPPTKPPDWDTVVDLGKQIISEKSKDLWIAAWLIEGLNRTDGFAGLRDGFRLVRELTEKHWDALHPRTGGEEDGLAYMVAQLSGVFDGVLNTPIYEIPITGSCPRTESDPTPRLSTRDYKLGEKLEQSDPDERRQRIENGAVSLDQFNKAADATSSESFRNLLGDVDQCLEEFNNLSSLLDEKCGLETAPPVTKTRDAIIECQDRLKSIAKHKLADVGSVETGTDKGQAKEDSPGQPAISVDAISNREEAFRMLLKVADYFRENEPHSVVSYSLEQVVRWGKMSLPQLLTELIGNDDVRKDLFRHTGISLTKDGVANKDP